MKILVINTGSSSIKYQLFDMDHQKVLASGIVEKIGEILWAMLPDGRQLGGAPANFAYHAKALGEQSYVVSAGDSFTAAMVVGLLRNLPLEIIHKNATNLASYVCTQKGATPKLSKGLVRKLFMASAT